MSNRCDDLSVQAKVLPLQGRARLAEELPANLDTHEPEFEAAWGTELRRRIEELDCGTVRLMPANQAFSGARRAIGQ